MRVFEVFTLPPQKRKKKKSAVKLKSVLKALNIKINPQIKQARL